MAINGKVGVLAVDDDEVNQYQIDSGQPGQDNAVFTGDSDDDDNDDNDDNNNNNNNPNNSDDISLNTRTSTHNNTEIDIDQLTDNVTEENDNNTMFENGDCSFIQMEYLPSNPPVDIPVITGGVQSSSFIQSAEAPPPPLSPPSSSQSQSQKSLKRIDFVLVYRKHTADVEAPQNFAPIRRIFESRLQAESIKLAYVDSTVDNGYSYVHLYANWDLLAYYAEVMSLRMPMRTIKSNLKALFNEECTNQKAQAFTTVFSRDKLYLFDIPEHDPEEFFSPSQRAQIIDFILRRTRFSDQNNDVFSIGINKLISDGVYAAAYPLHDAGAKCEQCPVTKQTCQTKRCELIRKWASLRYLFHLQPLDRIVDYFGVKIAMYYAWIGFYTQMLLYPTIFGIVAVIFGWITMNGHRPVRDLCSYPDTYLMCPTCAAIKCNYTRLSEACPEARASWVFGNTLTIAFGVFISLWATLFLEMWKRYSAEITHKWDLSDFNTIDEYPRPEFLANLSRAKSTRVNPVTRIEEPYIPWRGRFVYYLISSSFVVLCIVIALMIMVSVIIYRVSVQIAFLTHLNKESEWPFLHHYSDIIITATAAFINLFLIIVLSTIYTKLAYYLTELEMPRTQIEFDNSLTLKMFLFEFVNYYSSFFYIAFFKGRMRRDPPDGGLNPANQGYLVEDCPIGGCYLDLTIQMAIIFLGKNVFTSILEYLLPYLQSVKNRRLYFAKKNSEQQKPSVKLQQWEEDFLLESWDHMSLFYEYLEMVIQFGFVTIFVTAFPLAPLFAFINNFFEIRFDAKKMLFNYKRPVPQRVKDIGVWYNILDAIGKLSVFTNSIIIAFTTDFVPEVLYYIRQGTLEGYFNSTLSYYEIQDGDIVPPSEQRYCIYMAYRKGPADGYSFTQYHWDVLVCRLLLVIILQNLVSASSSLLKTVIADVPKKLQIQKRQHAYLTNELIIRHELKSRQMLNRKQSTATATVAAANGGENL